METLQKKTFRQNPGRRLALRERLLRLRERLHEGLPWYAAVDHGGRRHVREWRGKWHPTDTLPDSQCHFKGLKANLEPGGSTGATITAMGLNPLFTAPGPEDDAVGLHAVIKTPRGEIVL